jgi:zinc protease
MKSIFAALVLAQAAALAQPTLVTIPNKSPIVTFRIVIRAGSAFDAPGKPGTAVLLASLLSEGGTREISYKQILDRFFPMAASVTAQVDKEMITFSAATHRDNLEAFYTIFKAMLLDPGWRKDDLERLRADQINYLRVTLRGNNDEELGKEVLYENIYRGTPYGWVNAGHVSALQKMTAADLQEFYRLHFTQHNLVIGLAGGYPSGFPARVRRDFTAKWPEGAAEKATPPQVKPSDGRTMTIVEEQTRSIAISLGFPLDVRRGDPDYPALLIAQAYFGQHRISGGRLFERMRQVRGLNYGDYAYIEYFPSGMFLLEPRPNLARTSQIFQMWIRPVEPPTAVFALRLALFELDRLIGNGLSEDDFTRSRNFVAKYASLLTKTDAAQLGYKIDSLFYGIPNYATYLRDGVAKLTRDDVNRAIRAHLQSSNLDIVVVASNASEWKQKFLSGEPTPIVYNSPKPAEVIAEDKTVEKYPLSIRDVRIVPVSDVFE